MAVGPVPCEGCNGESENPARRPCEKSGREANYVVTYCCSVWVVRTLPGRGVLGLAMWGLTQLPLARCMAPLHGPSRRHHLRLIYPPPHPPPRSHVVRQRRLQAGGGPQEPAVPVRHGAGVEQCAHRRRLPVPQPQRNGQLRVRQVLRRVSAAGAGGGSSGADAGAASVR